MVSGADTYNSGLKKGDIMKSPGIGEVIFTKS
jgi:hypothetical protein